MKLQVGSTLTQKGHTFICTRVCRSEETLQAPMSSENLKAETLGLSNVKYISTSFEDFAEGDIITVSLEKIELIEPGKHIMFIFTYYNVKKGQNDESAGSEGSSREATHSASEADWQGNQSGEGAGEQSASQDCATLD